MFQMIVLSLCTCIIVFVLHNSGLGVHGSFTGYDCRAGDSKIATISSITVEECRKPASKKKNDTAVNVHILQREKFKSVPIIQCSLAITQLIYHCGMHHHGSNVRNWYQTFEHPFTASECQDLIRSNQLRYPKGKMPLIPVKPGTVNVGQLYVVGKNSEGGHCSGGDFTDGPFEYPSVVVYHEYKLLYQSKIARYELATQKLLIDGVACEYEAGKCSDYRAGFSFWTVDTKIHCDPSLYKYLYEGEATETYLVDSALDLSYRILTVRQDAFVFSLRILGTVTTCYEQFLTTDQDDIVLQSEGAATFRRPDAVKVDIINLSLITYLNTKFLFLHQNIGEQMEAMYDEIAANQCQASRLTYLNLLAIAHIDPDEFAYNLMGKEGYTSIVAGEVIHLIQCAPINVTYREDIRCFHELPIMYKNEPKFLTPRNRILVDHATEIECNPVFQPIYAFPDAWYTTSQKALGALPPKLVDPNPNARWQYEYLPNLGKAGIYSNEQLEAYTRKFLFPTEREAISNVLVNTLNDVSVGKQGLQFSNLFDAETIQRTAQSYFEKVWGTFSAIGQVITTLMVIGLFVKLCFSIIETLINMTSLYAIYGFSFRLLGALFHSLTTRFLHFGRLAQPTVHDIPHPEVREDQRQNAVLIRVNQPI